MIKLGILCFLALAATIGAFYVFWVIKKEGDDLD